MLLLLFFMTVLIKSSYSINCDACLNQVCYTKVKLWDSVDGQIYGQIAIDRTSNTLYFNHKTSESYGTAAINIDTLAVSYVPDFNFYNTGRAVDQETRDHYMYFSNLGLYKNNPVANRTEYVGLANVNGSLLQFKELLFFSGILFGLCLLFPDNNAQCFTKLQYEAVNDFVIDKYNVVYYRNSAQIKRYNIATDEIEFLFTNRFFKVLTDRELNVYYTNFAKVLKQDYETDTQVLIGGFVGTQITDSVFDRDNIMIYRDIQGTDSIFKLVKQPGSCVFNVVPNGAIETIWIDYIAP